MKGEVQIRRSKKSVDVAIAAARNRGEGEARTGGVDVPARLRRRVVRIMVRFRRWKERRASVEVAIYVKREGIETARPRGTKTRPTCSTQSWKRKRFLRRRHSIPFPLFETLNVGRIEALSLPRALTLQHGCVITIPPAPRHRDAAMRVPTSRVVRVARRSPRASSFASRDRRHS